jgi:hypothetical protein
LLYTSEEDQAVFLYLKTNDAIIYKHLFMAGESASPKEGRVHSRIYTRSRPTKLVVFNSACIEV